MKTINKVILSGMLCFVTGMPFASSHAETFAYTHNNTTGQTIEIPPTDEDIQPTRSSDIAYMSISEIEDFTYTGSEITPTVSIFNTMENYKLQENVDYTVTYADNINVTDYHNGYQPRVIITGIGDYYGTDTVSFNITPKDINDESYSIGNLEEKRYTGKPISIHPTVYVNDTLLYEMNDYECTFENNTEVGIATVTMNFYDNYCGSLTEEFYILPDPTMNVFHSSSKYSSATISWTPVSGVSGYNIDIYNSYSKTYDTVDTIYELTDPEYTLDGLTKNTHVLGKITPFILYSDGTPYLCEPTKFNFKTGKTVKKITATYLKENKISLGVGQSRTISYKVAPSNAINKNVIWSSSNPKIATVDTNGKITGIAVGNVTIYATAADKSGTVLEINVDVTKKETTFIINENLLNIVSTNHQKYTYNEMTADLNILKNNYKEFLTVKNLGYSYDKRKIYEVILGNPNAEKQLLIVGSTHGREYMTSQLVMKQIEMYCKYYYTGVYDNRYFNEIFEETCIHFVPMLNPDGVSISQNGAAGIKNATLRKKIQTMCKKYGKGNSYYYTRWKSNGRGVDLNRNYPTVFFPKKTNLKPSSENYYGSSASSEKETKIIISLYNSIKPDALITYHATGSIIYWKYGQSGKHLTNSTILYNITQKLTGYAPVKNTSYGTGFSNWSSYTKKTPSMTIEIGTTPCPLKISEFKPIWAKNKYVPLAQAKAIFDYDM